jgi:hypothetical protein
VVVANSTFASNCEGSSLPVNVSYTQGLRATIWDTSFDGCHAPTGSYPIITASQGGGLHVDRRRTTAPP